MSLHDTTAPAAPAGTTPLPEERHTPAASAPRLAPAESLSWQDVAYEAEARADQLQRRVDGLERALVSRPAIEQAKGVIMSVFGVGADSAFEALTWVSQNANVKLALVAEQFVIRLQDVEFTEPVADQVTRTLALATRPPAADGR